LRRLKRGLDKAGLDPRFFAWPPAGEADRAPYRGLRPLEGEDAGIFFGREAPIIDATDRLRGLVRGAPPRLMVILGASGAGKSSFLRAGLLPRLARDDWHFLTLPVIRPGTHPLTGENGLLGALEHAFPDRSRAELRSAIGEGVGALRPLLAEIAVKRQRALPEDEEQAPPAVVLAIDQAEELFSVEAAVEGAGLLKLVAELAAGDAPAVLVIFTIRSDNYDALERAEALADLRQTTLPLLPMPRGTYKDVIEGPARRSTDAGRQLTVEPQLTERLLADIERGGGSDALPLLGFTLEQLYVEYGRARGALRLADYDAFGGIGGAIHAAVERALVKADADRRIPKDRKARELLLRRGFIPWLAGIDPETRSPRRMRARRAEIPPEAAPLIDLLVEERLLTADTVIEPDPQSGVEMRVPTIEPAHEALLRQWGLLEGWLAEDFAVLATLEGVKRAARDWDANARSPDWLAHQGERLADAQALDTRSDLAGKLDPMDRLYLAACRTREAELRAEEETRRREREEEQARRLSDAQALAAANRRTAQRTRVGLAAALVLAVAAVGFGVVALQQQKSAEAAQVLALQQKAAAQAAQATAEQERNAAEAARKEAQRQKTRAENTLNAAVSTANTMVFNLAQQFRDTTGMPQSLVQSILDQAQQLEDHLVSSGETDPLLRRSEAATLGELARSALLNGNIAQAHTDAEQALSISQDLLKQSPEDRQRQRDVAIDLSYLAEADRSQGNMRAALDDYSKELAIFQPLAQDKSDVKAQSALANALEELGEMKLNGHDAAGALGDLKQSLGIVQSLVGAEKANPTLGRSFATQLATLYGDLGDAQGDGGDPTSALASYQQEVDQFSALAQDKSDALAQSGLALALNQLGDSKLAAGDAAGALAAYRRALPIVQAGATDKSNALAQQDVADTVVGIGDAQLAGGDPKSALASYYQALPARRQRATADPTNLQAQGKLAQLLQAIGDADLQLKDKVSAKAAYTEELGLGRAVMAAVTIPLTQFNVAQIYYRLAKVDDDPHSDLAEAISILDPLDKAGQLQPAQRQFLQMMQTVQKQLAQSPPQARPAPSAPTSPAEEPEAPAQSDAATPAESHSPADGSTSETHSTAAATAAESSAPSASGTNSN
jgi:tetratricopeptide (TPR) repeat protein